MSMKLPTPLNNRHFQMTLPTEQLKGYTYACVYTLVSKECKYIQPNRTEKHSTYMPYTKGPLKGQR